MYSNYLNSNSGIAGHALKIKKITASAALSANDSGSIILVNPAAATEVDLPSLSDAGVGWYCKIVLTEDTDGSDTGMGAKVNIDFGSGNDVVGLIGDTGDGAAGDMAVDGDDYIACTANASPGDMFDIFTDGERWYVHGVAKDASEVPFATAAG
tara:strand:- start:3689 stop:4150 length:462 start_codon:yes stop_codon:yes gene_type:complete